MKILESIKKFRKWEIVIGNERCNLSNNYVETDKK